MKPSEIKSLIKSRIAAGIKRPIMIEGSPGLGKSEILKQLANELGIAYKMISAPLLAVEDLGFPVINATKTDVEFIVSKSTFPIEGSAAPESGILVIEELAGADNSVQKALTDLVHSHDRLIHGKKLLPNWHIITTGNRTKDRAGASRILSHLANRMTRIQFDASLDDWSQWALDNGVKPEVIAFIRFRPELLTNFDPQNDVNATPRSWVDGISAQLGIIDPAFEFEAFAGDIGQAAASEFLGFLKIFRKLPSIDAISLAPDTIEVPHDPATLYAICGALAHRTSIDNFERLMIYVNRMPSEFQVLFIRDAMAKCKELVNTREFTQWASGPGAKLLT